MSRSLAYILFFAVVFSERIVSAQSTGPELPKPNVQPAVSGFVTMKSTSNYDPIIQKNISIHTLEISGDAATVLFSSLTPTLPQTIQNSNLQTETRVGRNLKCSMRSILSGKISQKAVCETMISAGEFFDTSTLPTIDSTNGKAQGTKTSLAAAKAQIRPDGVLLTITGLPPTETAAEDLFNSIDSPVVEGGQSLINSQSEQRTKSMLRCEKNFDRKQPVFSCSTTFNNGTALFSKK